MSFKVQYPVLLLLLLKYGVHTSLSKSTNCLLLPSRVNSSVLRLLSHNETRAGDGTFQQGSRVHFHCSHRIDGVRSKPDGRVICINGTWVGKRPKCKASSQFYEVNKSSKSHLGLNVRLKPPSLTCDSLPKIFQGDVRVLPGAGPGKRGRYVDGTRLTFSCRMGHLVPRRAMLICKNGTWNGTIPQCVVSQCLLPRDVNGGAWSVIGHNPLLPIVQRGWILEAVRIEYVCQPGLVLVGSKWRDCLPSGKWSGQEGLCVAKEKLYQQCQSPGILPNGRLTCNGCSSGKSVPFVGTVLSATCRPGYGMLGGEDVVHMRCIFPDDGNSDQPRWSRRMPKCVPNDELAAITLGTGINNGSLWSQDLTVVIAVSTVVMGGLLMIFTAVLACRCVRHAASGRRGRSGSPLHHHHHHPYTVSAASMAAGHRNEDCVALIVPPSYEEAVRDGGALGTTGSMGTPGPASTLPADGVNTVTMTANSRGGGTLHGSRFAHVLSRSPRIRTSGEGRDYRPLVQTPSGSRQSRRTAAAVAAATAAMSNAHHQHQQMHHHHHGSIPASAGEADSVSRHSTQTSGSHGPAYCLSGSLETMAVSDGTSVTLRTYESQHGGSNPSLISTRPQTGSLCEPQQTCQSPQQQQANSRGGSDTPGSNGGCNTSDVVRHATQTPIPAPIVGNGGSGNGNTCGTGYISAGSVVGSEKEDSLSTRS